MPHVWGTSDMHRWLMALRYMMKVWKQYQEEAASFFRSLGFNSKVEQTVQGVRGKHVIDVWVTGEIYGIPFKWVVECKHWKNNVPKEKVLALISIIQDIGADRGFLLSEVGFQSGAIRVSHGTNVILTSIADLKDETKGSVVEFSASKLHWRLTRVKHLLHCMHKQTGDYFSKYIEPIGMITLLDLSLEDALKGSFPVVYTVAKDGKRLAASDWEDFIKKPTALLDEAEGFAENNSDI